MLHSCGGLAGMALDTERGVEAVVARLAADALRPLRRLGYGKKYYLLILTSIAPESRCARLQIGKMSPN